MESVKGARHLSETSLLCVRARKRPDQLLVPGEGDYTTGNTSWIESIEIT